jgi:predicted phosphodiesterase
VAGGFKVVVSGHSHKPGVVAKDGVLFINPGSAGPRRFNLPISVAQLKIDGQKLRARIIPLKICVAGSS